MHSAPGRRRRVSRQSRLRVRLVNDRLLSGLPSLFLPPPLPPLRLLVVVVAVVPVGSVVIL
eukprot:3640993-Pyramimonas_sp.AAC.1